MTAKFKSIFTVSILLNVLLFGALAGVTADRFMHRPWEKMLSKDLTPETQNVMARTFQKSHEQIKGSYEEMQKAREDMAAAFSASTFDANAYEEAVKRMNKARAKVMDQRFETMKELAAELPQDERKKMAKQIAKGFGGYHKYGFKSPRMFDHPPKPEASAPAEE
jgi:uncharacterized membrane protein